MIILRQREFASIRALKKALKGTVKATENLAAREGGNLTSTQAREVLQRTSNDFRNAKGMVQKIENRYRSGAPMPNALQRQRESFQNIINRGGEAMKGFKKPIKRTTPNPIMPEWKKPRSVSKALGFK